MNLPVISPSSRPGKFRLVMLGRLRLCSSLLLLSLLLFTGCARNEPRADLVVINAAEPETLDPAILTGQPDMPAASDYASQLYYLKNGEAFNAGKIKDQNLVGVHAPDPQTVVAELNNPTAF